MPADGMRRGRRRGRIDRFGDRQDVGYDPRTQMTEELDLFPGEKARDDRARSMPNLEEDSGAAPLATRMRPRDLGEFLGQEHLMGPGHVLRTMIEEDRLASLILWGPPGSGKTTLARIIAHRTDAAFVPFSAVTEGVGRVREIIAEAAERLRVTGRQTILFCDEIHRFNRAQQDAFLPHVEAGTIVLIGATTENPSFEVNGALLSRSRVLVLEPLSVMDLRRLCERAISDRERGLGDMELTVDPEALDVLVRESDGDARRALSGLEIAASMVGSGGSVTVEFVREALQKRFARYDKSGEEHFNLISALHKSVRASDPDATLYWLARMLDGGEDPLYIARRLVRMAAEDVGLAEPRALDVAIAARDSYRFLGSPEGELALAEAALYLALAPKSDRLYRAFGRAMEQARETPAEPVPMHLRNAPTRLMRDLGYGEGYRNPHEDPSAGEATCLPARLAGRRFYEPSESGFEAKLAGWLERARGRRDDRASGPGDEGAADRSDPG